MCGRFTVKGDPAKVRKTFRLATIPNLMPRYNVAPTQDVSVVGLGKDGPNLIQMRWGLVPSWSKDPKAGAPLINARADTVAVKPAFREAFRKRRCLIVADGFYEWTGEKEQKQAWYITLKSGEPFGFAALWERWRPPAGAPDEPILSAAIVTTDANDAIAHIHHRMPVILDPADHAAWLDPDAALDRLAALLKPLPSAAVRAYRVGKTVNAVRNDGPECVAPLETAA
ncbi:MAG: SOS response-associated peptidase [Alphaproteobacteria bacterium]